MVSLRRYARVGWICFAICAFGEAYAAVNMPSLTRIGFELVWLTLASVIDISVNWLQARRFGPDSMPPMQRTV